MEATQQRRKITRTREFRSCVQCRQRKLKCDRQVPCSACTRRDDAGSCVYAASPRRPRDSKERRSEAEARLEHLEQLVQELSGNRDDGVLDQASIQSGEQISLHSGGSVSSRSANMSIIVDTTFKGATHWSAMLDDVEALRYTLFDQEDLEPESTSEDNDYFGVLFGTADTMSFKQILDQFLPQRRDVDRLMAMYFRSRAVIAPSLHATQFNRQYQSFWTEPAAVSPLWTSILFSILHVATSVLATTFDASVIHPPYVLAAAHCLAIGGYYKPQPFALEAMLLFAHAQCLASTDICPGLGILHSSTIRQATMMGYHRDPSSTRTHISPFQTEMRRRTWSLCMQLDLLICFQLGLPPNVQHPTWDTRPPSNLLTTDFDESTLQLPPARPDTEVTDILFYIAKHRIMIVFEKIMRHAASTTPPTLAALSTLATELDDVHISLPSIFHIPPTPGPSILDPPPLLVARLCVFSIYQKSLCVLHRPHVLAHHAPSITTCHAAASALLMRWADVWDEFEPGGTLASERWFLSTITWHDILLGCTTLCLVLCCWSGEGGGSGGRGEEVARLDVPTSLATLRAAKRVCATKFGAGSRDTRRVVQLMEATERFCLRDGGQGEKPRTETEMEMDMLVGQEEMGERRIWEYDGLQTVAAAAPPPTTSLAEVRDPMWEYLEQFLNLPEDVDFGNVEL